MVGACVVGGKADAPDAVDRTGLYQYAFTGIDQVLPQVGTRWPKTAKAA